MAKAFDQEGFDRAVERNYRWNFVWNVLDGTFFFFGMSFIADSTVIPVYVSKLTDNRVLIGLVSAIASAGWFLPQLLAANPTERLAKKAPLVIRLGFFAERLPLAFLAATAFLWAGAKPTLALAGFFLFYSWHRFGSGSLAPAWEDMIAKIIPIDRRGRFFGVANFGGSLLGIFGAQLTTMLLARVAFPTNFALSMAAGAGAVFLSWIALAMTREESLPPTKEPVSTLTYLRGLPELIKRDTNFARYLITRLLAGLGRMAVGFTTVYAVQRWDLPDQQAGVYTVVLLAVQTGANLLFGLLGDRRGHKLTLELSLLAWAAAMGLALVAPSPLWFYASFAAAGIATSGELVGGLMILLEFCEPDDRPTYVGLGNTTTGVFMGIAPVLGGLLANVAGFRPVFGLSVLLTLSAWVVLRFGVREPRVARSRI